MGMLTLLAMATQPHQPTCAKPACICICICCAAAAAAAAAACCCAAGCCCSGTVDRNSVRIRRRLEPATRGACKQLCLTAAVLGVAAAGAPVPSFLPSFPCSACAQHQGQRAITHPSTTGYQAALCALPSILRCCSTNQYHSGEQAHLSQHW